ncbi:hypothetical protein BH09PLA1_BH09PLA1_09960 [soil metagenome]
MTRMTGRHPRPTPTEARSLAASLSAEVPGFMLERDEAFPGDAETNAELDQLASAVNRGVQRRDKRLAVSGEARQ